MSDDKQDLIDFDEKLKAAMPKSKPQSDAGKAANATMDFTAPILGGILIGYGLDRWLETAPLFIIGMLFLGVGAGISNIYKASQNIGGTVGYSELHRREKNAKTSPSSDSSKAESD
jgi:ATP synthase protein I